MSTRKTHHRGEKPKLLRRKAHLKDALLEKNFAEAGRRSRSELVRREAHVEDGAFGDAHDWIHRPAHPVQSARRVSVSECTSNKPINQSAQKNRTNRKRY